MVLKKIPPNEAGLPRFDPGEPKKQANIFALGSHSRAKDALVRGLELREPGFNIFVVGEDRSGRMTATLAFLEEEMTKRPPPPDWLYLNNFRREYCPQPISLPAGLGRKFKERMTALVPQIRDGLAHAFGEQNAQAGFEVQKERLSKEISERLESIRLKARSTGLDIAQTPKGMTIVSSGSEDPPEWSNLSDPERELLETSVRELEKALSELNNWATEQQLQVHRSTQRLSKTIAESAISMLTEGVKREFPDQTDLSEWLDELKKDAVEHFHLFAPISPGQQLPPGYEPPEQRYAVNLLVDHSEDLHPQVVLEANPTYQNLFGRLEYLQAGGGAETNFTLIKSGALHRANGGVLVLRADALAAAEVSWQFLKGAIRDCTIRIEELHRFNGIPIAGAPQPQEIPLNLKVVIVGSPHWYYTFFSSDPEFKSYFKIKADIDADMPASADNLRGLGAVVQEMAQKRGSYTCSKDALSELLGHASRWADDRTRISSRFEQIDDLIAEAVVIAKLSGNNLQLDTSEIRAARQARLHRNGRVEDRSQEMIRNGNVKIDLSGKVIGQVNGLTVRNIGDHTFGSPSRITARTSIGRKGIVNIERDVSLGGPIQQKAAMILQGYFNGLFARKAPLSFTASMTFEQNYGGVEGDSASLAEAVAIISDLAGMPVKQSIAITGSMNQHGVAQSVGGVRHKIEGFFRACEEAEVGLTGDQGVIVPASNANQILLDQNVEIAIAQSTFNIWTVETLADALELMLGAPAGEKNQDGIFPPDSIFGRVRKTLDMFNEELIRAERSES